MVSILPPAAGVSELDWQPLTEATLRHAFAGCVSVESTPEGLIPWRLRHRDRAFIHPEVLSRVLCASGVRLELRTAANGVRLEVTPQLSCPPFAGKGAGFDLFIGGTYLGTQVVPESGRSEIVFSNLPGGEKEIVIYFPLHLSVVVHEVALAGDSNVALRKERPRWITHGSSITHCRSAASPGYTWPAIVAREAGWDHWNMGYGGQCRFDPIVARTIRDMEADRISLCLGINTAEGSFSHRTWRPAVEGFIMTIRDGHPKTPLLIISPILSTPRETLDQPPCILALKTLRAELASIVAAFQSAGDSEISYLDGLQIIGHGDEATMPDDLHPDANGIKLMARRFLDHAPKAWMNV